MHVLSDPVCHHNYVANLVEMHIIKLSGRSSVYVRSLCLRERKVTHVSEVSPDVVPSNDGSATRHGNVTSQDAEGGCLAST